MTEQNLTLARTVTELLPQGDTKAHLAVAAVATMLLGKDSPETEKEYRDAVGNVMVLLDNYGDALDAHYAPVPDNAPPDDADITTCARVVFYAAETDGEFLRRLTAPLRIYSVQASVNVRWNDYYAWEVIKEAGWADAEFLKRTENSNDDSSSEIILVLGMTELQFEELEEQINTFGQEFMDPTIERVKKPKGN